MNTTVCAMTRAVLECTVFDNKRNRIVPNPVATKVPDFSHEDFGKSLKRETKAHHHELFAESATKIALSANNDKRIMQTDKRHTLAHGHWRASTFRQNLNASAGAKGALAMDRGD